MTPVSRPFQERDPAASAPLIAETISTPAVIVIGIVIPLVVMLVAVAIIRVRRGVWVVSEMWWAFLGFWFNIALAISIVDCMKRTVGQVRTFAPLRARARTHTQTHTHTHTLGPTHTHAQTHKTQARAQMDMRSN